MQAIDTVGRAFFMNKSLGSISYKKDGKWHEINKYHFILKVIFFAKGLRELGLKKSDKVAIISKNRPEWLIADLAVLSLGGVLVPIYETSSKEEIAHILDDSNCGIIICENQVYLDLVSEFCVDPSATIIVIDKDDSSDLKILSYLDVESLGKRSANQDRFGDDVKKDDLATIIYTSGTTGAPKGVMLTHENIMFNCETADRLFPLSEKDVFLSILPPSHVFQRVCGGHFMTFKGLRVVFAQSILTVAEDIQEVSPTVMFAVPRLYEKMYNKIMERVRNSSPLQKKIVYRACRVGRKVAELKIKRGKIPFILKLMNLIAHLLFFRKIHNNLGGKMKYMASGGAPLSSEICWFFHTIGIPIYEGYGLTETAPMISANSPEFCDVGSVGKPVKGVDVKIVPIDDSGSIDPKKNKEGEVCARGPNVMAGYYNNETATREVMDDDGYFHTGDIGQIDDEGFLFITGRIKDIIITAGGKNIAPAPIEEKLKGFHFIDQVCIIGNNRPYLTALIVPAEDQPVNEALEKKIRKALSHVNTTLAKYQTIKYFKLLTSPFSREAGEITPTLKVKRNVVEKKYAHLIDEMYS